MMAALTRSPYRSPQTWKLAAAANLDGRRTGRTFPLIKVPRFMLLSLFIHPSENVYS
jgi:hypothetical protein